jgi:hypothetical protein
MIAGFGLVKLTEKVTASMAVEAKHTVQHGRKHLEQFQKECVFAINVTFGIV